MSPPRIVLACQSLVEGNGGIARVDRLIAGGLKAGWPEAQIELHVFSDATPPAGGPFSGPVKCYGGSRFRFTLGLWSAQRRPGHFIYDAAYLAKVHRRFSGSRRPNMIFLHGIEVWENARAGSIAACRRAHLLVANSRYTRDRAEKCHGDFHRARVCWLGTEAVAAALPLAGAPRPPVVLAVGRMEPREDYKGQRELIEAWPAVLARHPDARLRLVGRGGLVPQLQERARACGVAQRVEFAGFVPEENLAAEYRGATVFALPSRGEGFGLVYIEAMRHGLPVIASRHDAGAEVIEHERTGLLVDLDVPGDLAGRLCQLLERPEEARRLGLAGQQRWKNEFTAPAFRARFENVLREFLPLDGTKKI